MQKDNLNEWRNIRSLYMMFKEEFDCRNNHIKDNMLIKKIKLNDNNDGPNV